MTAATRRFGAGALAAGLTAGALAALPPTAMAADRLPVPRLSHPQVTPSSCARGRTPLAYSERPTLTVSTRQAPGRHAQLRFQVWESHLLRMSEAEREEYGAYYRPAAGGRVDPTRPGGRTFAWRVGKDLSWNGEYSWRARVYVDGKATSSWSVWRTFSIADERMPHLADCRIDGQTLDFYWHLADQYGHTVDEVARAWRWLGGFGQLTMRLGEEHPKSFVGGAPLGMGYSRRGWLVFRQSPSAGARAAIDRFRASHPGSTIRVIVGRDYTSTLVYKRATAMYEWLERFPDAEFQTVGADLRTGTIEVYVSMPRKPKKSVGRVKAEVLALLTEKASGYTVVQAGGGLLADAGTQPVEVHVRPYDPRWNW